MKTPLTLKNLPELVGKVIAWSAPAYKDNQGYHGYGRYGGIERITEIDLTKRSPILKSELVDPKSDKITWAFVDNHTLIESENGFDYKVATGKDNCLSYSDGDREIFFEIVDEN